MTDHIVVSDHVLLDISFRAARARLGILARDGVLLGASEEAYGEGITGLVQLAGPAAGLTRLARVGLENLAETDRCAHIALQWEASSLTPEQMPPGLVCAPVTSCHRSQGVAWECREHTQPARARSRPSP